MDLMDAKQILSQMSGAIPSGKWNKELATAVQRALAELHLLNLYDDVDGLIGPRTLEAWKFFKEATNQADPDTIEGASAGLLIQASENPVGFIGEAKVNLQPDFDELAGLICFCHC
ncbi:MAG: hypothetical protein HY881_03205 [Deltaproteobacteria bacterium]|nr:hypothetical protein [Deltaproteobacteria bacterium]